MAATMGQLPGGGRLNVTRDAVPEAAAAAGRNVGQRGAIIVSGFHRAMITLTAEMALDKRRMGRHTKKKKIIIL